MKWSQFFTSSVGKEELIGSCTLTGACEAVCPKEIPITNISRMHKNYLMAELAADH